ncbi:MAG: hypothetical protein ACI4WH_00805 [Oscillospiraceae bacterium]
MQDFQLIYYNDDGSRKDIKSNDINSYIKEWKFLKSLKISKDYLNGLSKFELFDLSYFICDFIAMPYYTLLNFDRKKYLLNVNVYKQLLDIFKFTKSKYAHDTDFMCIFKWLFDIFYNNYCYYINPNEIDKLKNIYLSVAYKLRNPLAIYWKNPTLETLKDVRTYIINYYDNSYIKSDLLDIYFTEKSYHFDVNLKQERN